MIYDNVIVKSVIVYEYVPLVKASSFLVSAKGYLPLDPFIKAAIQHTMRISQFREDVSILIISKLKSQNVPKYPYSIQASIKALRSYLWNPNVVVISDLMN